MKATLEFDLPDEREWFEISVEAIATRVDIDRIDNQLRSWLKHGHEWENPEDVMEWVRQMIPHEKF